MFRIVTGLLLGALALMSGDALAKQRTVKLKTLRSQGVFKLRNGEKQITIKVPRGFELRQGYGGTADNVTSHLEPKIGKQGTQLYKVGVGEFVVNEIGVNIRADRFSIIPHRERTLDEILADQRKAEKKALGAHARGD